MKPKHHRIASRLHTNCPLVLSYATACLIGFTANVQAIDLLNDTFADNGRDTQALPTSAQWFLRNQGAGPTPTGLAAGYTAAGGNLDLPYPASGASAHTQLAYFTAGNAPITLASTGNTLTLSFSLTLDSLPNSDNILRFGLWKSNLGGRLTADDNGSSGAPVVPPVDTKDYVGYVSQINPTTLSTGLYRRNVSAAGNQLVGGTTAAIGGSNAVATGGSPIVAGTPFNVTFILEKTDTGVQITSSVNGNSRSVTDTASALVTFDTLAVFGATALTNFTAGPGLGVTIDNVVVATNFAPPPPPAEPMKWAIGNGDWNTTSANWQPLAGGAQITYTDGSEVTFNDEFGLTDVAINLTASRAPATITNNSTRNYTFSGSPIAGTTTLAKSGSSTLTLSNANSYTGATSLTAGKLVLANQNSAAGSVVDLNGGTLEFSSTVAGNAFTLGGLAAATSGPGFDIALQNNAGSPSPIALTISSGPSTYSGILSGGGSLTKNGTGVLTLTQSNTYSGGTTLSGAGTLITSNPGAFGSGPLLLASEQDNPGFTTFELNGGINFSKPITINIGNGREHFTGTGGANTLSSPITITNFGAFPINFDSAGGAGNPFTVSGNITDFDGGYFGIITLRGASGGILSSKVTTPSARLDLLQSADNVVWTITSTDNSWTETSILSAAGPLVGGANQGFSGCKLIIGANDALPTAAKIIWRSNNNNVAGAMIDLAGFNQTVAGLDKPFVNASQPLPVPTPPLPPNPPVPNSIPTITNSSTTSDSTLTLAGLAANYAYTGRISDGPSRKISLVLDSAGTTQSLTGAPGFLSYTGNTTIVDGTLSVTNPTFADSSTVTIGTVSDSPAVLDLPTAGTDTVAQLVIDGESFTTGVFGNIDSVDPVTPTSAITGPGTITVEPFVASPYDTWVASFQPGFTLNLPDQDQDGDGLTNQQEFAFGLNPKSGSSVSPIVGGLPSNGQFSYTRLASSGLTYRVFTSTTLGTWTPDEGATDNQVLGPIVNGVQTVAVTLTASPVGGKLFARIEASE